MTLGICGYRAFIASLGAVVFLLLPTGTFAGSAVGSRGAFASARPISPSAARSFRHHPFGHRGRNGFGTFWGAFEDPFYGSSYGEPFVGAVPPASNDVHYTYKYDVPWDWAHRYPPNVVPSDRPYVSSCPTEIVKVPDNNGQEQTVNITRCY